MNRNLVVGLTGGTACGKTTVAGIFRDLGAWVVDADAIGHQILRDDLFIKKRIVCTFGRQVLDGSGEINRSKLGHIVFDNPGDLRALNELIHPTIIERVEAEIEQKLSSAKHAAIVVDAALLIELNLTSMVDSILG